MGDRLVSSVNENEKVIQRSKNVRLGRHRDHNSFGRILQASLQCLDFISQGFQIFTV